MTTLKIANGDIAVNEDRGTLETVTSRDEASQNVARHLLCNYSPFWDEGNELMTYAMGGSPAGLTNLVVDNLLTEAVNRLILKQINSDTGNRIIRVLQVKTSVATLSSIVFLIQVLMDSDERITVVDEMSAQPVQLNHTFNANDSSPV